MSERICENGDYFCKRDRNKAASVGIYTCKNRQTVRVGATNVCAPEAVVADAKLAEIELALARFVLTDIEARRRAASGKVIATDMLVTEALNLYMLERQAFHAEVLKRLEVKIELARAGDQEASEAAKTLATQIPSVKDARRQEENTLRLVIESVGKCWEKPPRCSELDEAGQLHYVEMMRKIGYKDSSIRTWLVRIFSAMNHALLKKRLVAVPKRVRAEKWVVREEEDVIVYPIPVLAKLFDAAYKLPRHRKYMNLSTHTARPGTIVESTWSQFNLKERRWNLNPPGKRLTKKRRPIIPICPSLAAEMATWARDHVRVLTNRSGKPARSQKMFERIQKNAGITYGSAMTLRKTVRTWMALHGVPEAIADWIMGHADEGAATGRVFYKAKLAQYMLAAVVAIELLYEVLRKECKVAVFAVPEIPPAFRVLMARARALYAFNVGLEEVTAEDPMDPEPAPITVDQPEPETIPAALRGSLRGRCVTELLPTG